MTRSFPGTKMRVTRGLGVKGTEITHDLNHDVIFYCSHNTLWMVSHTIQKRKKMAGQNTFQILLLNDANMIGEH